MKHPNCPFCTNPLGVLQSIIQDEARYQHWHLDKKGTDAFQQVLKWMRKIACHEVIELSDGKEIVPNHVNETDRGATAAGVGDGEAAQAGRQHQ